MLKKTLRYSPLTLRGVAVLLLGLYLIFIPSRQADLVAGTLGLSFIGLIVIFLLINTIKGILLKKKLTLQLLAPPYRLHPEEEVNLQLRFSPISIPPLCSLETVLEFQQRVLAGPIIITGNFASEFLQTVTTKFPHRGNWQIQRITHSLSDVFGLTKFLWETESSNSPLAVYPHTRTVEKLPVISSSYREGDSIHVSPERTGDPFDLKPYNPADGMRKILWKLYAKGGELISRHPEPAMTPEGKVMLFVAADQSDDKLIAFASWYCKELEALNLEILASTDGSQAELVSSANALEELSLDSVWQAGNNTLIELQKYLDKIRSNSEISQIKKILVVYSDAALSKVNGLENARLSAQLIKNSGFEPAFLIDRTQSSTPVVQQSKIKTFLFGAEREPLNPYPIYQKFVSTCLKEGWEVVS